MSGTTGAAHGPRVVLGMTLYNQSVHLPGALDSLLAQTCRDFRLVILDDASEDDSERIARARAEQDGRLRYLRHRERRGMIATWREVARQAIADCPSAEYFAWVSDHDRWHPEWLARLRDELDAAPEAVLAYPLAQRMTPAGELIDAPPRRFETAGLTDVRDRWRRFCGSRAGAGDMVYGLMRARALEAAGIFRPVLRPDRLLVAELVLRGEIHQVPEVLWFRRNAVVTSIARQESTLVPPGAEPAWFRQAPWRQHNRMLRREYSPAMLGELGISPARWRRMRARYQLTFGWRHARRSETSYVLGRAVDRVIDARKLAIHHVRHAVYHALVALHGLRRRGDGDADSRSGRVPDKSELP